MWHVWVSVSAVSWYRYLRTERCWRCNSSVCFKALYLSLSFFLRISRRSPLLWHTNATNTGSMAFRSSDSSIFFTFLPFPKNRIVNFFRVFSIFYKICFKWPLENVMKKCTRCRLTMVLKSAFISELTCIHAIISAALHRTSNPQWICFMHTQTLDSFHCTQTIHFPLMLVDEINSRNFEAMYGCVRLNGDGFALPLAGKSITLIHFTSVCAV